MTRSSLDTRTIHVACSSTLRAGFEPKSDEEMELKDHLLRVVQDILDDHDIAARYTVEISDKDEEEEVLCIRVEDREVRVVRQQSILSWRMDRDLATRVAESLFVNRELLLPPDVAQSLWEEWTGAASGCPGGFLELLNDLIARGVRITRLREHRDELRVCASTGRGFNRLFEEVLDGIQGQRIRILVSQDYHGRLYDQKGQVLNLIGEHKSVEEMLRNMGDLLFYELGIVYRLDGVEMDESLKGSEIRFKLNDLCTPRIPGLEPWEFLVNVTVDRLTQLDIKGRSAVNPANGLEAAIVNDSEDATQKCLEADLTTWREYKCTILMASHIIRRSAGALFSTSLVELMLQKLAQAFPALVERAQVIYEDRELTGILRNLIDEQISIRDLRSVLECLVAYRVTVEVDFSRYIVLPVSSGTALLKVDRELDGTPEGLQLAEGVRSELKRYISHKYTQGSSTLVVYLLDPQIEARLAKPAALDPVERRELIEAVELELGNLPATAQSPVILTTMAVRARARREIEKEYPRLAVLSYQELIPEMNIQPIARISLP